MSARVVRVHGALVEARPLGEVALHELVRVGRLAMLGEVIRLAGDRATIQVFEETTGLALGEPVVATGAPLQAELGPGLLGAVLDGVGRPLPQVAALLGDFLTPGADAPTLDPEAQWGFEAAVEAGSEVSGGDVLGTVALPNDRVHRILLPPDRAGTVATIGSGSFSAHQPFGALSDGTPLTLAHRWPIRRPRPVAEHLRGHRPMLTGQRIFDFLFPVSEGGTVAVPGGFGTGKTVVEQCLARYADADIIVYVGCGERGNEMANLLAELPHLEDPRTGRALSERTVLVVNTSNMPVAAREASVQLGFTLAEYFRDQGLRVALLADSLSRWAEALREIASRLRVMPGEEGYPTTLGNRLGTLYERSGRVRCLGSPDRTGSITFVSAISPPGGDFSEPVTQASLRVAGTLWALDPRLAHQRQFPAVSWEVSYSAHADHLGTWFADQVSPDWPALRHQTLALLQQERELREVAELVGQEALEDEDRLILEVARMIREVVTGQNAFDPLDAFCPPEKTCLLARLTLAVQEEGRRALQGGADWEDLALAPLRRGLVALRDAPEPDRTARATAVRTLLDALGGAP